MYRHPSLYLNWRCFDRNGLKAHSNVSNYLATQVPTPQDSVCARKENGEIRNYRSACLALYDHALVFCEDRCGPHCL
jgi:hypothetical protein